MSDLIYRDELKKTIKALVSGEVQQLLRIIDGQPKVDAKIEQHGHWIVDRYCRYRCALCGWAESTETNYCPECGAKMDEEEKEG